MPTYTREQLDNIRRIKALPEYRAASPRERKSLFEAVMVESGIRDLNHGDRDSKGILQQRNNGAWGAAKEDVETDVRQYLAAAKRENTKGGSAGQLAQRVQRSAFPGRYDQRSAEADALVASNDGVALQGNRGSVAPRTLGKAGTKPTLTPGGSRIDTRSAVKAALLDRRKGMSLLKRITDQVDSGDHTTTTSPYVDKGTKSTYGDKVPTSTKRSGSSKATVRELFWNGPGDVNVKDGKRVGKGFVSGHEDHVHLAADEATMKRAAALAKRMGLHVGGYGKGITSGHVKNSNHYTPFGAMDVSGARMAEFARAVADW